MKRIGMMSHRYLCAFVCGLLTVIANSGCTHLMEARAIGQFSEALLSENYDDLVASSSTEFESKALRQKQAIKEFKLLKFPKGKTSIENVEEISENNKLVTVSIAGTKKKLKYHLVKNDKSKKWVVNDVMINRKKNGEAVTESVMEQMNLLLSVREFMAAWSGEDKQEILDVLSPEFQTVMVKLPAPSVVYLTQKGLGKKKKTFKSKPAAEIDDNTATVRVPRQAGELVIDYIKINEQWKVDNISLNTGDDEKIESFRFMAMVLNNATNFIQAFQTKDRKQLKALSTPKFYQGSLVPADLSIVKVPSLENKENIIDIKLLGKQADFMIEDKEQVFKISLALTEKKGERDLPAEPKVEDVTIYDLATGEEKRLSALFTSHAIIEIFADAIASRNVDLLKKTSSVDFNKRVWSNLTDRAVKHFPLDEIGDKKPQVLSTKFAGALTEVSVLQGDRRLTYLLRDQAGELRVDDVLLPVTGRPKSFKTTMEMMSPVRQFAAAIASGRVNMVQRTSSKDFNRLIWHQVQGMPVMATVIPDYMNGAIRSIQVGDELSTVVLGDDNLGAKITIVSEHGLHVVDNIEVISGPAADQHAMLKQSMQRRMGEGKLTIVTQPSRRQSAVKPAVYQTSAKPTKAMTAEELLRGLQQENGTAYQQTDYKKSARPISPPALRGGEIQFTPNGKTLHGNGSSVPDQYQQSPRPKAPSLLQPGRRKDINSYLPPLD